MAKQCGPLPFTGTIGNICFYKLGNQYYARMKSSLSSKRVKKDPAFRRTMQHAGILAQASRLASTVYSRIPKDEREHSRYRKMTGAAILMLREEKTPDQIILELATAYLQSPAEQTMDLSAKTETKRTETPAAHIRSSTTKIPAGKHQQGRFDCFDYSFTRKLQYNRSRSAIPSETAFHDGHRLFCYRYRPLPPYSDRARSA